MAGTSNARRHTAQHAVPCATTSSSSLAGNGGGGVGAGRGAAAFQANQHHEAAHLRPHPPPYSVGTAMAAVCSSNYTNNNNNHSLPPNNHYLHHPQYPFSSGATTNETAAHQHSIRPHHRPPNLRNDPAAIMVNASPSSAGGQQTPPHQRPDQFMRQSSQVHHIASGAPHHQPLHPHRFDVTGPADRQQQHVVNICIENDDDNNDRLRRRSTTSTATTNLNAAAGAASTEPTNNRDNGTAGRAPSHQSKTPPPNPHQHLGSPSHSVLAVVATTRTQFGGDPETGDHRDADNDGYGDGDGDGDVEDDDETAAIKRVRHHRRHHRRPLYRRLFSYMRSAWTAGVNFSSSNDSEAEELDAPIRYRPDSLSALCRSTRFTEAEIKRIYRGFKAECPSGVVKEDTFKLIYAQFFPQGANTGLYAHYVFNTLDQDHSGIVSFEEFVHGLSTLSRGSIDEKLQWAFALYDINGDGYITRDEMTDIVTAIFELMGRHPDSSGPDMDKIKDKVESIFRKMDLNQDGVVTLDEFIECCRNDDAISRSINVFDTSF